MSEVPSFLEGAEDKVDETKVKDSLELVSTKCKDQLRLEREIHELDTVLKEKKKELNQIAQQDIPAILADVGLSSVTLDNGFKVTIKSDINVTVKDHDNWMNFIKARGEDDIVKDILAIEKPDDDLVLQLVSNGYEVERSRKVHHATQKKYIKGLLEEGINIPEELVKVFEYNVTKITN